jgi:hypothetical protein
MAATFDSYFINATVFSDATSIFTDSDMTIVAPDGVYQFNGVHRTMSGGVLGSPFFCGTCCANCSGTYIYPIPPAKDRYHEVCSNIGNSTNTAIVVKFKFTSVPIQLLGYPLGLRSLFDGQFYEGVSSNRFGYLPEFFVGDNNIFSPMDMEANSPYALEGYAWQPLISDFVQTQSIPTWVTSSMVNVTLNNPDECYMLVPKTTSSSTITVQVFSPHKPDDAAGGGCDITIPCPFNLESTSFTSVQASVNDACAAGAIGYNEKYNVMNVNGQWGIPDLYDRIFYDSSGLLPVPSGYYGTYRLFDGAITPSSWVRVGSNGQVEAVGICSDGTHPTLTKVTGSTPRNLAAWSCLYQNQAGINLPDIVYWHDGAGDAPQVGDGLFLDVLGQTPAPDGFYQLLREYMSIQVSGGVLIGSINYC